MEEAKNVEADQTATVAAPPQPIFDPNLCKYYSASRNLIIHDNLYSKKDEEESEKDSTPANSDADINSEEEISFLKGKGSKTLIKKLFSKHSKLIDKKRKSRRNANGTTKCEIAVIYAKQNGSMGVRKILFRLHINQEEQHREEERLNECRNLYKKILIDHPNFDYQTYKQCSRFFNPTFWEVNLAYSLHDNQGLALEELDQWLLKDEEKLKGEASQDKRYVLLKKKSDV